MNVGDKVSKVGGDYRFDGIVRAVLKAQFSTLRTRDAKLAIAKQALSLIAMPKRADGTYNRCREACEQLARDALEEIRKP